MFKRKKSLLSMSWTALTAVYCLLSINLVGCKDGMSVADSAAAAVAAAGADIQLNGVHKLTISGRTMGKVGTATDALASLPNVSILAIVDGVSYRATSSAEGGFGIRDVPMRPPTDNTSISDNLATIVLYIEKPGWIYDGDTVTAGNQNWISVKIDSHLVDSNGNYHVDLGPLKLTQSALKVTSSLVKSASVLPDRWLGSSTSVGGTTGADEVYMRDVDSQITLTFNMPVDVTYNTNFVEIFNPSGASHGFYGSWDLTGMVYTIVPNPMTASNDDFQRWQLRIARPVRAFDTSYETRKELDQVSFSFQVLSGSRNTLLTASAPTLAPELDGTGYTGYSFDSGTIYKSGYRSSGNTIDVVTSGTSLCVVWNQTQAATNFNAYRIYARSPYKNFGSWSDETTSWSPFYYMGDGRMYACNSSLYSSLASAATLKNGDQIQLVVTPVDKDGNEGAISAVTTPLTISDNWGPSLLTGTWSKTYTGNQPDEYFASSQTGRMTMTFSEVMDPWTATKTASITSLSGLMNSLTASQFKLTSTTAADVKITYSMKKLDTTLLSTARTGDTVIRLTSIDGLKIGHVLKIVDASLGLLEDVTIASIKSADNIINITPALTNSYAVGSKVRLTQGESGNSLFITTTSADAYSNATTLAVADGSKFLPNQSVKVYMKDEYSTPTLLGTYTVTTATTTALNLSSKLGKLIPNGAIVADAAVSVTEPQPRATSAFTPNADIEWSGNNVSTSLSINNFKTTPDAQTANVLVASTSNLSINDIVTIAESTVTNTLSTEVLTSDTILKFTSHAFLQGDTVRVSPPNVLSNLAASSLVSATTLTLATAVTVGNGESVTVTDPAYETKLTTAFAIGATSITVADASGIVEGQTIVIDSGVEVAETKTVQSVSVNSITLNSALANNHGVNGRVTRAPLTENKAASSLTTNSTSLALAALTNPYSTKAYVSVKRNYVDFQISALPAAITTTDLPIPITAANYFPAGTAVTLLSYPETRRITAINGNILTLSAALVYSHRLGATVTKGSQYTMQISGVVATVMANWIVGDTIVCDSMADGSANANANLDRFEGTITAMDNVQGLITVTTSRTGRITKTVNFTCTEMGDAIKILGVLDSNSQAIRTTWGNKINLSNGTAK